MRERLFDLDVSPSPEHLKGDPMTAVEIDSHADSGRIWATLAQVKAQVEDRIWGLEDEIRCLGTRINNDESDQAAGQAGGEYLRAAFVELTRPKGLTKANLNRFKRLFNAYFGEAPE